MDEIAEKLEEIKRKYGFHVDADDDEPEGGGKSNGNTHLPYGLCEKEGIDTKGMTPREAWEAYFKKTGVSPMEAYKNQFGSSKKIHGMSLKVHKAIKSIEDRIKNDKVETAAVVDEGGNVVIDKSDGSKDSVQFSGEETAKMVDSTLTHNHPGGHTFSTDDLVTACKYGLKTIRAVHANGAYTLTRIFEFDPSEESVHKYIDFPWDFYNAQNNYMKDTVDKIWKDTGDADKCNGMVEDFRRKWLKDNSEKYGWTYEEE